MTARRRRGRPAPGGGRVVRRLLAALLALGAVVAFASAAATGRTAAAGAGAPPAGTPVFSVRRAPGPVVDAAAALRLQADLERALAATGVGQSCAAVADGTGVLAAVRDDLALVPASTEKVLTGAAALAALGPDTRLRTAVVAAGPVGPTVDRLWLVGGGDPVLATPEYRAHLAGEPVTSADVTTPLAELADRVVAAGVRRVAQGVAGADGLLDDQRFLPTWRPSYRTEGHVGPIGALVVDDGFVRWTGTPVPADDPAVHAAGQLARLLRERGVAVGTATVRQEAPAGALAVAEVASPPLAEVVASMMRSSNNTAAEVLARLVGLDTAGDGSTAAGTAAVAATLAGLGVPVDGLVLVDGSGLDRGNRASCRTLLAATGLADRPEVRGLRDGLAVAGRTGTLVERFVGTPLEGRLRAKTGSLQGVTGLVGEVDAGRTLRFALVLNGTFTELQGVALREQLAAVVGAYPAVPPADALVPEPAAAG